MRILLAMLICLTAVTPPWVQKDPPGIPIVKTWEDLQAVPAIELGDGVKIRLGLEADKIPQWSGGLLYCLAEGYAPPQEELDEKRPFGPVHLSFAFEKEEIPDNIPGWMQEEQPKGTYLYTRPILIDRVGTYHITVADKQKKVLARAAITGSKDFFHPWMPWLKWLDQPEAPWEAGIVVPALDNGGPTAVVQPDKIRKGKLPRFWPSEEKLKMTIELEGKELVIRSETTFRTSWPDLHFVARWWVNEKPFVPTQSEKLWRFNRRGLVHEEKELRQNFEFHAERLGAKPGDKVGLQIMYVERGWVWCASEAFRTINRWTENIDGFVRYSNRIEFVVQKN